MKPNPNIFLEQLNRLADTAKEKRDELASEAVGFNPLGDAYEHVEDYRFYNKVAEALPPLIEAYTEISKAAELFHEIGMAIDARKLIAEEAERARRAPPGERRQLEGFTRALEEHSRTDAQLAQVCAAGFEKLVGLLIAVGWRDTAVFNCNPLEVPR